MHPIITILEFCTAPNMSKTKRKIRNSLNNKEFRFTSSKAISTFFVISTLIFISAQLYTNAILSPLGHKLASLNTEKNLLLEENRELEQDIAKNSSITIISKYAEKKLQLEKTQSENTVYATPTSVQASR